MRRLLKQMEEIILDFHDVLPEHMDALQNFLESFEKPSVLDNKTKELINVALSTCLQNRGRTAFHVKKALQNGATHDEIVDVGNLAILMYIELALRNMIPMQYALSKFALDELDPQKNKIGVAAKTQANTLPLSKIFHKIPAGAFLQPTFTWSKIWDSGNLVLGIHPVLVGITGEVDEIELLHKGEEILKGDSFIKLHKNDKVLSVKSPIKGTITSVYKTIFDNPTWENLSQNWIYCIKPVDIDAEVKKWFIAERAKVWINEKYAQVKKFFINVAPQTEIGITMADGGDIPFGILSQFDKKIWQEFERKIMSEKTS